MCNILFFTELFANLCIFAIFFSFYIFFSAIFLDKHFRSPVFHGLSWLLRQTVEVRQNLSRVSSRNLSNISTCCVGFRSLEQTFQFTSAIHCPNHTTKTSATAYILYPFRHFSIIRHNSAKLELELRLNLAVISNSSRIS